MTTTDIKKALLFSRDTAVTEEISQELLRECVLPVFINGVLTHKMVCTRGHLRELVLGYLRSEGKITDISQVEALVITENPLSASVKIGNVEKGNGAVHSDDFAWKAEDIFRLADAFRELTPLYRKTKGIHSCLLMYEGEIRHTCEDIGRHNALDKVIGHAMADGLDLGKCIVYSSGRIPEDMIAKAIRTGIPVLASKATPTARAVELARRYHVVLICNAHPDSVKIFSSKELWELPVSAGILAGGSSSRMGKNKMLLDNRGETFLSYMQNQCAFLPETLFSFRSEEQVPQWAEAYVLDEKQLFGPLEGIYQLLKAAKNDYVLILAADMQRLDQPFLERFLRLLQHEDDCMILKGEKGLEPLCGVYSRRVLPVLSGLRQQDLRRPRLLFDRVRTHYVTAEDLGLTEEELSHRVNNINTPEDYQNFLKNKQ